MAAGRTQPGTQFGQYTTAFVDLLGFKAITYDVDRQCRSDPGGELCRRAAARMLSVLRDLRLLLDSFYAAHDEHGFDEAIAKLPPEASELAKETFVNASIVQIMSDCYAVSVPLDPENSLCTLRALSAMLAAVCGTQLLLLSHGVPCRGGIAMGVGCVYFQGEITGASISRAVELERHAYYPRVVVDPDLVALIDALRRTASSDTRSKIEQGMAEHIASRLILDNGATMTDFRGSNTVDVLRGVVPPKEWDGFLNGVRTAVAEGCSSRQMKIRTKYEWLTAYLAPLLEVTESTVGFP